MRLNLIAFEDITIAKGRLKRSIGHRDDAPCILPGYIPFQTPATNGNALAKVCAGIGAESAKAAYCCVS